MRPVAALVLVLCASPICALEVRKGPEEYPLQASVHDARLGVEYTVQSFLADGHSFTVNDHLLVEIGVFPIGEANVNLQRFQLRVNNKDVLLTQTPGMVAASLEYPDWTRRPSLQASAGGVLIGRPTPVGRFPGDPTVYPGPRVPQPVENTQSKPEPINYTDVIASAALPEGKMRKPVCGYIFFPYNRKLKSIKSVELLLDGQPELKLR